MAKHKVPKNTKKTSKWAMTNINNWFDDYNNWHLDSKCPDEFLTETYSKEILCKWLGVFVNGTPTKN